MFSPSARSRLPTCTAKQHPASIIAFVQTLEAAVIAQKAAREKRLADVREREASRRYEADRQKAAAEQAKAGNGDG